MTAAVLVWAAVGLTTNDTLAATMAGALALVGAPLLLRQAKGDNNGERREPDDTKSAALLIATLLATGLVAVGWLALVWALSGCTDLSDDATGKRYCDFFLDDLWAPRTWPIYAVVTAAPFITMTGGLIAVRKHHALPLIISTAVGMAIMLGAGLPFRLT